MTLALGLFLGGNVAFSQEPMKPPVDAPKADRTGGIIVPIGKTVGLQMKNKQPITGYDVDDAKYLRAVADNNDPTRILITGLEAGTTRITLTGVDKTRETVDVVVQADLDRDGTVPRRAGASPALRLAS